MQINGEQVTRGEQTILKEVDCEIKRSLKTGFEMIYPCKNSIQAYK